MRTSIIAAALRHCLERGIFKELRFSPAGLTCYKMTQPNHQVIAGFVVLSRSFCGELTAGFVNIQSSFPFRETH
jgi:hypothetical protein